METLIHKNQISEALYVFSLCLLFAMMLTFGRAPGFIFGEQDLEELLHDEI